MSAYLRNAAGFFVQVFPCMLMVFLPFSEGSLRFGRRTVFAAFAGLGVGLAALFPALMGAAAAWDVALGANLYMLAAILLTLAAESWLVREAAIKKVLVLFAVFFYGASQYWLVNILIGVLAEPLGLSTQLESGAVYSPCGVVMYALTAVLLFPIMDRFVLRPLREYLQEIEMEQMRQEFFILVVSTAVFLALLMGADMTFYRVGYRRYVQEMLLFVVVLLDQVLIYWLVFRESVRRKRDSDYQRAMEMQQLQYERIVSDMESTRRMRHDMRHHYNALNEMLQKGKLEEMKGYLAQVLDATAQRLNEVFCENMVVNGLLQYYAGLAREEGIRCAIQAACGELSIEPADLTVLFGNALENAVNACRKCPDDKWIRVQVGTVQGSLAVEIANSCREVRLDRRYQTADGFSPAEAFLSDGKVGYGLRSIAHTAQKYGGSAMFRFNAETRTFTARMRLNMPTGMNKSGGGYWTFRPAGTNKQ